MKVIWNGIETKPRTCPQECVLCLGQYEGEFIRLECGHGLPNDYPMHVTCTVQAFGANEQISQARCPICRQGVSDAVLARVSRYLQLNPQIVFPDENGKMKMGKVCEAVEDQKKFLDTLKRVVAPEAQAGHSSHEDKGSSAYWMRVINDWTHSVQEFQTQLGNVLERGQCTQEEVADASAKAAELEEGAAACIKQAEMLERQGYSLSSDPGAMSYREIVAHLHELRETFTQSRAALCQREETLRRQEEEHAHHPVGML